METNEDNNSECWYNWSDHSNDIDYLYEDYKEYKSHLHLSILEEMSFEQFLFHEYEEKIDGIPVKYFKVPLAMTQEIGLTMIIDQLKEEGIKYFAEPMIIDTEIEKGIPIYTQWLRINENVPTDDEVRKIIRKKLRKIKWREDRFFKRIQKLGKIKHKIKKRMRLNLCKNKPIRKRMIIKK
jgi:hypothetical protein